MVKPPSRFVARYPGTVPTVDQLEAYSHTGLTEEQIVDIFSSAGKVLNFRLVYDRETGRPKGFGFAEYPDSGSTLFLLYNSYNEGSKTVD